MLQKVISGGQTGVDQAGLAIARELRVPTGGWAPNGWRTDAGPAPWLADFGLVEHASSDYAPRTRLNVFDSTGTVWFGTHLSSGYRCTRHACDRQDRPFIENPCSARLVEWCGTHHVIVLNVAGNRLRMLPSAAETARVVLRQALPRLIA
jgi:hypothetical protein